jgi:hypothetical protein
MDNKRNTWKVYSDDDEPGEENVEDMIRFWGGRGGLSFYLLFHVCMYVRRVNNDCLSTKSITGAFIRVSRFYANPISTF